MKTSTKLLIVFLCCLPLSLLAYNYLLKRQYAAGNFVQMTYFNNYQYETQQLPPFKHIVINGSETGGSGENYTVYKDWMPHMAISNNDTIKTNYVKVLKQYQGLLKAVVKNETLFITFYKKSVALAGAYNDFWHDIIQIKGNNIKSIDGQYATFNFYSESPVKDTITMYVHDYSTININNLIAKTLQAEAYDNATINIEPNNKITVLNYSLYNKSTLKINPVSVQISNHVHLDSLSKISINGSGSKLSNYLSSK